MVALGHRLYLSDDVGTMNLDYVDHMLVGCVIFMTYVIFVCYFP